VIIGLLTAVTWCSPVESAGASLADEANKENWDHTSEVDIHKILQTLDRDMENEAAGELLAFCGHQQMAPLMVVKGHCFTVYVKYDYHQQQQHPSHHPHRHPRHNPSATTSTAKEQH
jgi:hypothetical protein